MTNMRANALYANLSSLYHLGGVYSGLHDIKKKKTFSWEFRFPEKLLREHRTPYTTHLPTVSPYY